jgi:hypothetical protein
MSSYFPSFGKMKMKMPFGKTKKKSRRSRPREGGSGGMLSRRGGKSRRFLGGTGGRR